MAECTDMTKPEEFAARQLLSKTSQSTPSTACYSKTSQAFTWRHTAMSLKETFFGENLLDSISSSEAAIRKPRLYNFA
jgi:hypothetical protein